MKNIWTRCRKRSRDWCEKVIEYRELQETDVCRELFSGFIRHQKVVACWRKCNGRWIVKDDPFEDDWNEEDYEKIICDLKATVKKSGFVCAAFCDGILKGFVSVSAELFGGSQKYIDLEHIYVSEDMRRNGIGKNLFYRAAEWAREKGAGKLYISAHSAVESQAFYRNAGCVEAVAYDEAHVAEEPFDCQMEYVLDML